MNKQKSYIYSDVLHRSIAAFRDAATGPDPDGQDKDAPTLDNYLPVLQGRQLYLSGRVTGHPRLGSTIINTSMLIHVTDDARWARTLSRWYRLKRPMSFDTSRVASDVSLEGYCVPMGGDAIGIPLRFARILMAKRPAEMSRLALEIGHDEAATILAIIGKKWPPEGVPS